ncbi:putative nucleoredoxin 1-2 [Apium graveolens]|uniref:putative nucleoredoxin 1-2 n=1 Tax=Apium graveolens TaxID=4045 RepID=UPI003D798F0E
MTRHPSCTFKATLMLLVLLKKQNSAKRTEKIECLVKAEHLAGKVLVLYFSLLSTDDLWKTESDVTLLEDQYSELYPGNGFEIVFIAAKDVGHKHVLHRDSQKQFEKMFSLMPWTAIPFSDIPFSKSLLRRGFPKLSRYTHGLLIVDSTGRVLQYNDHAYDTIERYGFKGYPFSDERIFKLISEYDDIIAKTSLHTLLASPQCDYVISNKGDKVYFFDL